MGTVLLASVPVEPSPWHTVFIEVQRFPTEQMLTQFY